MENESLGLKSFKGVLWSVFGRVSNQGMGFIMGVILARIIAPESYGLIAMAMVVIAITGSLIDGGFGMALIRKKKPSANDYYTVFWFNIITALVIYLTIFFAAPAIETFYNTEGLVPVIRYLSLALIIRGLTGIQNIQLTKKLDFKALNIISLIATFISGVIGITMAYSGYGVWALVAQQLTSSLISSIIIVFYNRWMPAWIFSKNSFNELFAFSRNLLASSIITSVFQNLYPLVIGKVFAPAMLAYYTRADSYQNMISKNITSIVRSVSFPSLVQFQDDNQRLVSALRQMLNMIALINTPILVGLIVVAEPLIVFMITDKWLQTVPYLQLLCITGLLYPLSALKFNLLNVKGRSDLYLKLELIKKLLFIPAIIIGINWGVMGLVLSKVCLALIAFLINSYYALKIAGYSLKHQITDIMPYILIATIMAFIVWGLSFLFDYTEAKMLVLQIGAGIIIYFSGCYVFKLKSLNQLIYLLKKVYYNK